MSCNEFNERLHEWADGELEGPIQTQVRDHLAACADCRERAESIRQLKHLVQVKHVSPPVPAGLESRVREVIALEAMGIPWYSGLRHNRGWQAAAAVLVLAIPLLIVFSLNSPPDVHAEAVQFGIDKHMRGRGEIPIDRWQFLCSDWDGAEKGLGSRLGAKVALPRFADNVSVDGYGIYDFRGNEVGKVFCKLNGRHFSVFVLPGEYITKHEVFCFCKRKSDYLVVCRQFTGVYFVMVSEHQNEDEREQFEKILDAAYAEFK